VPINIIYIDDEPELCEIFSDLFDSEEVHVQVFSDPDAAILEIHRKTPDLLFVDYRLPNTNGEKIAKSLQLEIPIILITGDLNLTPAYPFAHILKKPYEPSEVQQILEKQISKKIKN